MKEVATFSLTPQTLDEAMKFAELIAHSDLAPKDYKGKPGNVLVAVQMGSEVGLAPMQAIQNIAVINGRPSLWGDAVLALVKGHPQFEYVREWLDEKTMTAYCELKRRGEDPVVRSFSQEDAKVAGLLKKQGPWTQYPKRMMQMRARNFTARDVFPDALKGLNMAEEVRDITERDITPEKPSSLRERVAQKKTATPAIENNAQGTLKDILNSFFDSNSLDELAIARNNAMDFVQNATQEEKDQMNKEYGEKKKSLEYLAEKEGEERPPNG